MSEIIQILIGKGGIQLGNTYHELFCKEFNLYPDGTQIGDTQQIQNCFLSSHDNNTYTSQSILIDFDNSNIDEIKQGKYRSFYENQNILSDQQDAEKKFSIGYNRKKNQFMHKCLDQIRKAIEQCENIQGFQIFHSIGGGTGSGFTSLLTQNLKSQYDHKDILGFTIFPSLFEEYSNYEICNTILGINSALENMDEMFIFDNKKLLSTLERLDIFHPSYRDINKIIAYNISPICNKLNSHDYKLRDYSTDLSVYPKFHFYGTSLSPIIHEEKYFKMMGHEEIANYCFNPDSNMMSQDLKNGSFLAANFIYQGDIEVKYTTDLPDRLKRQRLLNFVDWVPRGVRQMYDIGKVQFFDDCYLFKNNKRAQMIYNHSTISEYILEFSEQYDGLVRSKDFIQKYTQGDLEEIELVIAQDNINDLLFDYAEAITNQDSIEIEYSSKTKG